MAFNIVRDDLTRAIADAVVLPSNSQLVISGGVGLTVAKVAGLDELQAACDAIGGCPVGEAVATPAFNFPAKHFIHAVGPVWEDGEHGEIVDLHRTYWAALELAEKLGCESVALPLISSGTFGFPSDVALDTAMDIIRWYCLRHDTDITLYLFDRESAEAGRKYAADLASFIDDEYVDEHAPLDFCRTAPPMPTYSAAPTTNRSNSSSRGFLSQFTEAIPRIGRGASAAKPSKEESRELLREDVAFEAESDFLAAPSPAAASPSAPLIPPEAIGAAMKGAAKPSRASQSVNTVSCPSCGNQNDIRNIYCPYCGTQLQVVRKRKLDDMLDKLDETFSVMLMSLIDASGMTDAEVYRRANISRQLFSKIRSNENYQPTKKTVLAFSIALKLDLAQTQDLLKRAGFSLTNTSKFDIIVKYFILEGVYDIFTINEALFAYDQPLFV